MATEKQKKKATFREGTVGWYLTAAGYKPRHKNSAVIGWFAPSGQEISTKEAWSTLRAQLWPTYPRIEREAKRDFKRELKEIIKKGPDEQREELDNDREPDYADR